MSSCIGISTSYRTPDCKAKVEFDACAEGSMIWVRVGASSDGTCTVIVGSEQNELPDALRSDDNLYGAVEARAARIT
jgi:hypothetical protein